MNQKEFLEAGRPEELVSACVRLYAEWDQHPPHGLKPGSDQWLYDMGYYRPHLIASVRNEWADEVGREPHEFPWKDDMVAHMWNMCRKNKTHTEAGWARLFGSPLMRASGCEM